MTRPSGPVLALLLVLAFLFAFAGYHDAPSDTDDLINTAANLTDAEGAAVLAGLSRK